MEVGEKTFGWARAFHASFSDAVRADVTVLKVSRGTAVILLLVYVLYLLFQLNSHAFLYKPTPQHIVDEESHPGILQRMHSTSSSSMTTSTTRGSPPRRTISPKLLAKSIARFQHQKENKETTIKETRLVEIDTSKGRLTYLHRALVLEYFDGRYPEPNQGLAALPISQRV
ncbi:MAG: hypothetical protein Q9171_004246 [Xanthocarpia ochracea]